jgi:transposase
MGKAKSLSAVCRAQIVAHHQNGRSQRDICALMHCSKTAVQQAITRFTSSGSFHDAIRSGRPRATTARHDRLIRRFVVANPLMSAVEVQRNMEDYGVRIGRHTVKNRLKDVDLKAYRPTSKPLLTGRMKAQRLAFAVKYKNWTANDWRRIMWSDEAMFSQFRRNERWIRRPSGQKFNIRYATPTVKHSPSIMVWGCFSAHGHGSLNVFNARETVNAARYLQVLDGRLQVHMEIHGCDIYQQDSAPCHTARVCRAWFQNQGIRLLDWPGNSPDLNPIEHLWAQMKRKVAWMRPSSISSLKEAILSVWEDISPASCEKLVSSMPSRIAAVVAAHGGPTRY